MKLFKKPSGIWGVDFRITDPDTGVEKRKRVSLDTRDHAEAKRLAPIRMQEAITGPVKQAEKKSKDYPRLEDVLEMAYNEFWTPARGCKTSANIRSIIKQLNEIFGPDLDANQLDFNTVSEEAQRWVNEKLSDKPIAIGTVNRRLDVLNKSLKFAARRRVIKSMPDTYRMRGGDNRREEWLDLDMEEAVLRKIDQLEAEHDNIAFKPWALFKDLVIVLTDTGCRRGELLLARAIDIKWSDDGEAERIYFQRANTKTNQARRVLMSTRARKSLMRLMEEPRRTREPLYTVFGNNKESAENRVWCMWNEVREQVPEIGDATLHALRHTCGTRLALAGARLEDIADWLGHSNLNTTRTHYMHLLKKDRTNVVNMLDRINETKFLPSMA